MQMRPVYFPLILVAALLALSQKAQALSLSKDTVYESRFSQGDPTWSIWNDSVSLINKTQDTVTIEAIYYSVPAGKVAQLQFGFGEPYMREGNLSGIVIYYTRPYIIFDEREKTMFPYRRVPISGFYMERCIECPLSGAGSSQNAMDTLVTYLIFETKLKRDTLVVIGDVRPVSTGFNSKGKPSQTVGSSQFRPYSFFNILGRFLPFQYR
jgi:hypothetical protein